jgi:hypothetical protein
MSLPILLPTKTVTQLHRHGQRLRRLALGELAESGPEVASDLGAALKEIETVVQGTSAMTPSQTKRRNTADSDGGGFTCHWRATSAEPLQGLVTRPFTRTQWAGLDSNQGPWGYEPPALTG